MVDSSIHYICTIDPWYHYKWWIEKKTIGSSDEENLQSISLENKKSTFRSSNVTLADPRFPFKGHPKHRQFFWVNCNDLGQRPKPIDDGE